MLSIEQEPIRLPSILSDIEVPEGRKVCFSDRKLLLIPRRFLFLWDQTRLGASIYDLSLRLRARGDSDRVFLEVASFLCFLVDHDLIDDVRIVRLADSIRGEYQWPSDTLTALSTSSEIYSWGRRFQVRIPMVSRSFDFLTCLFVILSLPSTVLLASILFNPAERLTAMSALHFIFGLLLAGTIGRTGTSIFRWLASVMAGDAGELRWSLDPLGPHLSFRPHTVTGAFRRATDFLMCFGSSALPLLVLLFLPIASPEARSLMLMGSLFVTALSTHPMTEGWITQSLRVWNRTPMVWREEDELKEVEFFHRIGGFFSVTLAAVYIAQVFTGALRMMGFDSGAALAFFKQGPVLLLSTIFLKSILIYIEPFFQSFTANSTSRNRRRRLWATKAKVLFAAASDREAWNELPVLRQLTAPLRRTLVGAARVIEFKPGVAVCRQGETDRSLYIVLEGKFAVAKSFEGRRRKVVAILSEGAAFGETAFFFGTARTADVVAMESARVLEIPYLKMMKDLDLSSSEEFQFRVWLLQALSGNELLKNLPSEAMDSLIFAGSRRLFKGGVAIFTEGAPADKCYFIAQGRASVVMGGRKISEVGPGDAFGEIALLKAGGRRTASVVADSDLLCMELDAESFWSLMAARLPLGAEVERMALRRLRGDEIRRLESL